MPGGHPAHAAFSLFLLTFPALTSPQLLFIATGRFHNCVITSSNGLRCWGNNNVGYLCDGTTNQANSPPTSDTVANVSFIAAGDGHTVYLTPSGALRVGRECGVRISTMLLQLCRASLLKAVFVTSLRRMPST